MSLAEVEFITVDIEEIIAVVEGKEEEFQSAYRYCNGSRRSR
jgi:hypothetical protein